MKRLLKTLPADNGELYVISSGQRRKLAFFTGNVEIDEIQTLVPILGTLQKGTKKIHASFIICGDLEYHIQIDDQFIHSGKIYEAIADVAGQKILFSSLKFDDSDPMKNTLTFEVTDLELVEKLLEL